MPITDTTLQSFSFYIDLTDTCTFRGYVYAWDGAKATGAALYESSNTATVGSGNFEKIDFKTGGIALAPGARYVLFASASKTTCTSTGTWGITGSGDVYSGGNFVFLNNGTNPSLWTTNTWNVYARDLAFTATFAKSTILYWNDSLKGTDYMKAALANVAETYSTFATTASGLADFESKVDAGGWDLVIFMNQGSVYSTPNFNDYVSGGGRAILADWSKDITRGSLFGVAYTGHDNQDAVTITDDLLFGDVDNPVSLTNPGWPVAFSRGMAAASGTVAATYADGDAAIVVGTNARTIVQRFSYRYPHLCFRWRSTVYKRNFDVIAAQGSQSERRRKGACGRYF